MNNLFAYYLTLASVIGTVLGAFRWVKQRYQDLRYKSVSISPRSQLGECVIAFLIRNQEFPHVVLEVNGNHCPDFDSRIKSRPGEKAGIRFSLSEGTHDFFWDRQYFKIRCSNEELRIFGLDQGRRFHVQKSQLKELKKATGSICNLINKAKETKRNPEGFIEIYHPTTSQLSWTVPYYRHVVSFDTLPLAEEMKEQIDHSIARHLASHSKCRKIGKQYRRGYCFYGQPGTGKTTAAISIAAKYNLPVYTLSTSTLSNQSLIPLIRGIATPAMLLYDDFDRTFDQDSATADKQQTLSLQLLLQVMDGAISKDGVITVITANDLSKVHEVLRRPGRIDEFYEFKGVTLEAAAFYFRKVYDLSNLGAKQVARFSVTCHKLTLAQVIQCCDAQQPEDAIAVAQRMKNEQVGP